MIISSLKGISLGGGPMVLKKKVVKKKTAKKKTTKKKPTKMKKTTIKKFLAKKKSKNALDEDDYDDISDLADDGKNAFDRADIEQDDPDYEGF